VASETLLESWNDTPARRAIVAFEPVTDDYPGQGPWAFLRD
jgi:hypothetical protein